MRNSLLTRHKGEKDAFASSLNKKKSWSEALAPKSGCWRQRVSALVYKSTRHPSNRFRFPSFPPLKKGSSSFAFGVTEILKMGKSRIGDREKTYCLNSTPVAAKHARLQIVHKCATFGRPPNGAPLFLSKNPATKI